MKGNSIQSIEGGFAKEELILCCCKVGCCNESWRQLPEVDNVALWVIKGIKRQACLERNPFVAFFMLDVTLNGLDHRETFKEYYVNRM